MSVYEELRRLPQLYARAIDARDLDALASLFHPEARITGVRGTLDRTDYIESLGPSAFEHSMHVLADPLIDIHDDGRASMDTYAVVLQLDRHEGGGDMTVGMRYHDTCVPHEGRWVIVERNAEMLWMR